MHVLYTFGHYHAVSIAFVMFPSFFTAVDIIMKVGHPNVKIEFVSIRHCVVSTVS